MFYLYDFNTKMGSRVSKEDDCNGLILSGIFLPIEIMEHILNYLNLDEKIVMMYVCKWWSKLIHIPKNSKINPILYHANNGNDHIIIWLIKHGYRFSKNIYHPIIYNNCMMSLKFMISSKNDDIDNIKKVCVSLAIQDNNLEALKIIYESVYNFDNEECDLIARLARFEMLEWIYKKGYKLSPLYYMTYGKQGRLDILKFLLEKDGDLVMDWRFCIGAVEGGHLDILKLLKSYGYSFSDNIYASAARNGKLEILEWLKENNIN